MLKKLIIILLLLIAFGIQADVLKLTLHKAISIAQKNNPEILQEKEKLKQAESRKKLSFSAILPSMDISGQRILKEKVMKVIMPSFIPGEPPIEIELDFTRNYQFTFQIVQPIFTGGKLFYNLKSAKEMEKAALSLFLAKSNEIKARTKSTFYSIILLNKSKKIIEDGLKLVQDLQNNINVMYKQGMVTRLDLLRAQTRTREMLSQKLEVDVRIYEAKNNLKNLLNLPLETILALEGKIEEISVNLPVALLEKKLIKTNPILKSLENRVKLSKYNLNTAYGALLPDFSLVAQYNFRGDSLGEFSDWDDNYAISLNISYPIFRGFAKKFNISMAKSLRDEALIKTRAYKNKLFTWLKNLLKKNSYLLEKVEFARRNVSNTREEHEIAGTSYKEGMISYTDLEQIQNKYLSTRFVYFQSIFEYYTNIFKVETLISEDIFSGGAK